MAATDSLSGSASSIYDQVERYPWEKDSNFLAGLSAILGDASPSPQSAELTLRARCFYFERKFSISIDFNAYKAWRQQNGLPDPPPLPPGAKPVYSDPFPPTPPRQKIPSQSTTAAQAAPPPTYKPNSEPEPVAKPPSPSLMPVDPSTGSQAPYPSSFAHIVELITSGKPIPGIKEIPPTVLEGQGTKSVQQRRRKPWEKEAPRPEATRDKSEEAT